jgi:hypothetical protein
LVSDEDDPIDALRMPRGKVERRKGRLRLVPPLLPIGTRVVLRTEDTANGHTGVVTHHLAGGYTVLLDPIEVDVEPGEVEREQDG